MKDLKFRAWLKNENKMVDVISINTNDKVIAYIDKDKKDLIVNCDFDNIELMIGLKIYGDEVVFIGDVVRIYGGEQMFNYYEVDKIIVIKDLEDLLSLCNMDYGIDVLGNLYKNPELLEEL